jgi:hypothetical protein
MRLHRLLYASRSSTNLTPERLGRAVDDILVSAVKNNTAAQVTGLLLVHDGWFVQALEGPEDAVRGIYSRIYGDPRHREVTVLAAEKPSDRVFGQWAMCARTLSPSDEAIDATLSRKGGFHPVRTGAPAVFKLLLTVRDIKGRIGTTQAA